MHKSHLIGIRIEIIVQTEMVIDGHQLYSEQDLLQIPGIEIALGRSFDIR